MSNNTKSMKLTNLAENLFKKGINEEAIEALKRSIRLGDKEDMYSYLQVASELYNNNDYEHAKIFLNIFLEHWNAAEAYFILARIHKDENMFESAVSYYEKGFELYSSCELLPYHECLSLYTLLEDDKNALDISKRILKINKQDKTALLFLANYHKNKKLYKEASKFYEMLIKYDYADYDVYSNYGMCCSELQDYPKAEAMYIEALERYPIKNEIYYELKTLRHRSLAENYPNLKESEEIYYKKIESDPDVSSYYNLGNIEFIKCNYDKAASFYTKAKEMYELNL